MHKIYLILSMLLLMAQPSIAGIHDLQNDLALKYLVQPPADKSQRVKVVILLHGYGSNEADLFELRAQFPKNYIVIAPRAPIQLTGNGYQWYESTTINGHKDGKQEDLNKSRALIVQFIKQVETKYKVTPADVVLSGFSQGAIMSYEVGLTEPSIIKGIGVLSGMLYPSLKPQIKNTPALKKLRIFIAHGSADERLSYAEAQATSVYLRSKGLAPEFHSYQGMGHNISNEVMTDFLSWLK